MNLWSSKTEGLVYNASKRAEDILGEPCSFRLTWSMLDRRVSSFIFIFINHVYYNKLNLNLYITFFDKFELAKLKREK